MQTEMTNHVSKPVFQQMVWEGLYEILGAPTLGKIANEIKPESIEDDILQFGESFNSKEISAIAGIFSTYYGEDTSRGLITRAGRSVFRNLLRQFGHTLGFFDLDYHMQTKPQRIYAGIGILTEHLSTIINCDLTVSEFEKSWEINLENAGQSDYADVQMLKGYVFAGILQELTAWVSGGKVYPVDLFHQDINGIVQIKVGKVYYM